MTTLSQRSYDRRFGPVREPPSAAFAYRVAAWSTPERGASVADAPCARSPVVPGHQRPDRPGRQGSLRGPGPEGVALAAAAAEGGGAEAAAAPAQLVQQVQGQAVARRADRVAEGDGAAVDVDDRRR